MNESADKRSIKDNRYAKILHLLREEGDVRVERLSEYLRVSPVTVRRDLDFLNKKGYLSRTHGGASTVDTPFLHQIEHSFFEKKTEFIQEKTRIAHKAAEFVDDASSAIVFLNSGTTVLFFLEVLKNPHARIITNNAAAVIAQKDPEIELSVLGGEYRAQSRSFVGDMALRSLEGVYSDYTVLGVNGLSLEHGLMTTVFPECSINRAMIANTRGKVIVLADHSKMGKSSNFTTASLDCVDIVVTDSQCSPAVVDGLQEKGIQVCIV